MRRIILAFGVLFAALTISAEAAVCQVSVMIDGQPLETDVAAGAVDGTTYVPLRAVCEQLGGMAVTWSGAAARGVNESLSITAVPGSSYLEANGRYFHTGAGSQIATLNGRVLAPVRTIARAFDAQVDWHQDTATVHIRTGNGQVTHGDAFYDPDAVYWLSRIISAESMGEPLAGQIAVGNVVLNRVKSSQFPNTIYGVIFDRTNGVQFTPIAVGSIYWEPSETSVIAAKMCLDGADVAGDCLYFLNSSIAQSSWILENRTFAMAIGNHQFYH